MKFKKILFTLIFLPSFLFAQHTIKATFSPAKDFKWAILYKNTPTGNKYIAQGKIENGSLSFTLDPSTTKGIYKLVYAAPQSEYNFDIIYNTEEDIELTFNTNDGAVFQKSSENILLNNYLNEFIEIGKKIETAYSQSNIDKNSIVKFYHQQTETQKNYEETSNGKLVNHFIKANKPYIPKEYESPTIYIENLSKNYFKNINFSDPVLQSSSFLIEKSLAYILGIIPKEVDKLTAYNTNIDIVSDLIKSTSASFQKSFLDKLWQKLVTYKLNNTANYLAERHLIPLATQFNDNALVLKLTQFKNLSIGNVAPNFTWETFENGNTETHQLKDLAVAENYILVFWSSACSHCLKKIPLLKEFVQTLDSTKYKVIAIGLEDGPEKWEKEIEKYPEFINVIKLKKWDNSVVTNYGLTSTPTYFVLDRDKKFTAKPENLEDLIEFIKN